jgi:hypothetical protein
VNCDHCHYEAATPDSANNTGAGWAIGGSHNAHFQAGANSAPCTACHPDASGQTAPRAHINDTSGATDGAVLTGMAQALPAEALVTAAARGTQIDATPQSCDNASCHNPSGGAYVATWGTANALACAFCHSETNPGTGSHDGHLLAATGTNYGITVACTDCHVDNATGNNYDHTLDSPGVDFSGVSYVANSCGTNDCHRSDLANTAPVRAYTWGTPLANDCASCHEGTGMASNTHDNHLGSNALSGTNLTFNSTDECVTCHDSTTSGGGLAAAGQHLDTTVDLSFAAVADYEDGTAARAAGTGGLTTCGTVRCHNGVTTPEWDGTTSPIACGDCHGTGGALPVQAGTARSHPAHANNDATYTDCDDCHGTVEGVYTATGGANHQNLTVDMSWADYYGTNPDGTPAGVNYAGAGPQVDDGTCNTGTCHGSPATAPQWGESATVGCDGCHTLPPDGTNGFAEAAHNNHYTAKGWTTGVTGDCTQCHPDNTGGHQALDGSTAVNYTDGASAGVTCTDAPTGGCHNGQETPEWTVADGSIVCLDCHTVGGANGASQANPVSGLHNTAPGSMITGNQHDDGTSRRDADGVG